MNTSTLLLCTFILFSFIQKQTNTVFHNNVNDSLKHISSTKLTSKEEIDSARIIIKFREELLSKEYLYHTIHDINDQPLKRILKQLNVKKLKAVFENRYDNGLRKKLPVSNEHHLEAWQVTIVPSKKNIQHYIEKLREMDEVEYAFIEKPIEVVPCLVPNDISYGLQWHLNNPSNPGFDIDAEDAWDINTGRSDVVIAVLDGGVDYTHPDLDPGDRSRVIAGKDTGDNDNDPMDNLPNRTSGSFAGHGTNVAGIIGAIPNNNQQLSGVMWNCSIMPVKMVRSGGIRMVFLGAEVFEWDFSESALTSEVTDAIDYAVNNNAHVINLSYGFPDLGSLINDVITRVPLLYEAIDNANQNNVVVVAAMGNEFNEGNQKNYPAGFSHSVIAVGATDQDGNRCAFSNTGSHINVCAPGIDIFTTDRGGLVDKFDGTSMSTPIVAGVAALIFLEASLL